MGGETDLVTGEMARPEVEWKRPRGVRQHSTRGLTQAIDLTDWRATVNGTRTQCTVDGCTSNHLALGYRLAHYKRLRRHGDPLGARHILTDDERFTPHVQRAGSLPEGRPGLGPCWVWTGTVGGNGYGYVNAADRSKKLAHRVAYERTYGAIPDGTVIDHLCRNRRCVNPHHLEAVSNEENLRRGLGYRLRNGMDTACVNGHRYTPENTYRNPNKPEEIRCRTCARDRDRTRRTAS